MKTVIEFFTVEPLNQHTQIWFDTVVPRTGDHIKMDDGTYEVTRVVFDARTVVAGRNVLGVSVYMKEVSK